MKFSHQARWGGGGGYGGTKANRPIHSDGKLSHTNNWVLLVCVCVCVCVFCQSEAHFKIQPLIGWDVFPPLYVRQRGLTGPSYTRSLPGPIMLP